MAEPVIDNLMSFDKTGFRSVENISYSCDECTKALFEFIEPAKNNEGPLFLRGLEYLTETHRRKSRTKFFVSLTVFAAITKLWKA